MKSRIKPYDKKNILYLTVIFFLIIFSGCATKEAAVRNVNEDEVLRERVMTYWGHKIRQELDKSYEYEDPYYRKKVNMINYIKSINVGPRYQWAGVVIEGLKINGDSAIVDMRVKTRLTVNNSVIEPEVAVKEKWLKADGMWYHIQGKFKDNPNKN